MKKMLKKAGNVVRKVICRTESKLKYLSLVLGCALVSMSAGNQASAASATEILKPLKNLNTLLQVAVGLIGGFVFIFGITKFADSFKKRDQNGEHEGAYSIAAGAILIAADLVYTFLNA